MVDFWGPCWTPTIKCEKWGLISNLKLEPNVGQRLMNGVTYELPRGYKKWAQVGAYFDGDGSLLLGRNRAPFYFEPKLHFSDQSIEQLEMLRNFLSSHEIRVSKVITPRVGANSVAIGHADSVLRAMRAMMPFTYKKSIELRAAILYCEDKITGNDFQRIMESDVDAGRRERHRHRSFDSPYFRSQGREILLRRRKQLALVALAARRKVTPIDQVAIVNLGMQGLSWSRLQSRFPDYSTSTLRRVAGGCYQDTDRKLKELDQPSRS